MGTNCQPELVDYGIHNEASNIRAHVAPLARIIYVFPTICAVRLLPACPKRLAFQPGVTGPTAEGHLVRPADIPNLRRLAISEQRLVGFAETLSTAEKGSRAVRIVEAFLKAGRFPLWIEGEFATDHDIQVTGTDLTIRGKWRIEVKCDFRASDVRGAPDPRCTGHLYLQTGERNPLRLH